VYRSDFSKKGASDPWVNLDGLRLVAEQNVFGWRGSAMGFDLRHLEAERGFCGAKVAGKVRKSQNTGDGWQGS